MRISVGVADLAEVPARKLEIRRGDACVTCGDRLAAGTTAWWDPEARTITCTPCRDGAARRRCRLKPRFNWAIPGRA